MVDVVVYRGLPRSYVGLLAYSLNKAGEELRRASTADVCTLVGHLCIEMRTVFIVDTSEAQKKKFLLDVHVHAHTHSLHHVHTHTHAYTHTHPNAHTHAHV